MGWRRLKASAGCWIWRRYKLGTEDVSRLGSQIGCDLCSMSSPFVGRGPGFREVLLIDFRAHFNHVAEPNARLLECDFFMAKAVRILALRGEIRAGPRRVTFASGTRVPNDRFPAIHLRGSVDPRPIVIFQSSTSPPSLPSIPSVCLSQRSRHGQASPVADESHNLMRSGMNC
jgi:hypothetical protein